VGTTPETATVVAAPQTALAPGKYTVTAQIVLSGTGGRTDCRGRGPGATGPYLGQFGWLDVSAAAGTLTLVFGADLASGGTVNIACWQIASAGAMAGPIDLVAVKVGDLTPIS
jgi:hypothetical protein